MAVKFQPLTDFVLGKYFADEAAFAKVFADMGFSPFPAHRDDTIATKTWNAPPTATYKWGGEDRAGFVIVDEGKSVKVIDQPGKGEQYTWTTPIVPFELGQLLTNAQAQFYVDYRNHPDYEQGIPRLSAPVYLGEHPSWLATMNFSTARGARFAPPLDHGKLMSYGMRFTPGSTAKRMEDVEVFLIEDYRREFKPPAAQPKPVGEYKHDDATVATMAMSALFTSGTLAEKGAAIRKAAEERK